MGVLTSLGTLDTTLSWILQAVVGVLSLAFKGAIAAAYLRLTSREVAA